MMRNREASSAGLAMTRRYARMSLTSLGCKAVQQAPAAEKHGVSPSDTDLSQLQAQTPLL